ncbi:major facilitator superfamily MFS_1 [Denitrovibrio acetiphilus DSM 12809]|uniref:Major facilitator superfamily MFS_1 n=1 Tax=Denitrovibrio acetiphilus (strain DSM 12809 / NBRC 114555 / N2460) TaxID=522772 RepID=D4H6X6_DENA2|nr:MFS transporter [Denitrovibrio acetiphilus]ADD67842.1 major facilitator superfamily MFS_1 [Denitrovibrio acetiphilus DSM 12809]
MTKIAILSLSLLTIMSGAAVAPAIADIVAAFPDSPAILGKLVLSTPALAIIPVSLITGFLSNKISRKTLIYTGLILYTFGGAGGGFADSITVLLAMRFILGAGVGILMPISMGIIADIYSGDEKIQTMGFAGAANNLGGVTATILSGFLAAYHWRASFGVYLLGIIVLILVALYIPDNKPKSKDSGSDKIKIKNSAGYLMWGIAIFLLMVVFYTIPINISLYISQKGLGGSEISGIAISVMNGTAFITGLVFGKINKLLKRWLPIVLLTVFSISFYLLASYPMLPVVTIALMAGGFSMGAFVPFIMNGVTSLKNETNSAAGTSVVSSFLYAGQFASPLITDRAALLTTGNGISNIFLLVSISMAGLAVILIIHFASGLFFNIRRTA